MGNRRKNKHNGPIPFVLPHQQPNVQVNQQQNNQQQRNGNQRHQQQTVQSQVNWQQPQQQQQRPFQQQAVGNQSSLVRSRKSAAKRGICRFYLQGRCTNGSACEYLHEMPATQTNATVPNQQQPQRQPVYGPYLTVPQTHRQARLPSITVTPATIPIDNVPAQAPQPEQHAIVNPFAQAVAQESYTQLIQAEAEAEAEYKKWSDHLMKVAKATTCELDRVRRENIMFKRQITAVCSKFRDEVDAIFAGWSDRTYTRGPEEMDWQLEPIIRDLYQPNFAALVQPQYGSWGYPT